MKKPMRKKLIILEGISGAGKSTLLAELNRQRNFLDYHWHRFTATEWVYGVINNRPVNLVDLRKYEQAMMESFSTTLITLTCDPYVALKRKSIMPDEIIEPEIGKANKLFVVYHNLLTSIKRKIILCTNDRSVEDTAQLALKRILAPDPYE